MPGRKKASASAARRPSTSSFRPTSNARLNDGEPDIKVEKRADVERCTPEGGCDFTIRVTNVGDAPYNGPIVLDEVTTPGNAPVVSGPNALWACPPMVSPMVCTHPATTLDPGEWIELKLGFAPGPGWDWDFIRNCAEYDYKASGIPEVFGSTDNDKDCARIPICRRGDPRCDPPVEKKVDLRITKDPRSLACSADGVCTFIIRVFNNGTRPLCRPADGDRRVSDRRTGFVELRADPALGLRPDRRRPVPVRPSRRQSGAGCVHPDLREGGRSGRLSGRSHPQLRGGERHPG